MSENLLQNLTNEELRKKFPNQFDLVTYAIKLADNMIKSGRAPRSDIDVQNPAIIVLEEISEGREVFVDIPPEQLVEAKKQGGADESKRAAEFSTRNVRDDSVYQRLSRDAYLEEEQPKRKRRILVEE